MYSNGISYLFLYPDDLRTHYIHMLPYEMVENSPICRGNTHIAGALGKQEGQGKSKLEKSGRKEHGRGIELG